MRRRERTGRARRAAVALLGLGAVSLFAVSGVAHATTQTPLPEPKPVPVEVDDATFTWSLNEQTNARSHNPGAINFLAAGLADPGRGGATLPSSKWQASAGAVTVQKRDASGVWQPATWDGLGTDAHGAPIDVYGPFSGHRVHIRAGAGVLDATADDATLSWTGQFTVVYYSGNTVFTLADPELSVRGGVGSLTAQIGGWNADRNDPTLWTAVDPQRVTVADLSGVDVTETGLTGIPAYGGVQVQGGIPQSRTGTAWGSFPASMIAFLEPLGVDQFWYSTGLQSDWTKVPAPVVVGYGGQQPPEQPVASAAPTPTVTPTNKVLKPPRKTSAAKHVATPAANPKPAPASPVAPPVAVPASAAGLGPSAPVATSDSAPTWVAGPVVQPVVVSAVTVSPALTPTSSTTGVHPGWWVGGLLLLGAAALLLAPVRRP